MHRRPHGQGSGGALSHALHRLVWTVGLLASCAGSTVGTKPVSPPTDTDACPRLCSALERCGTPPADCVLSCGKEREGLRPEVHGGYVSCVETELAMCASMDGPTKRQRVTLCFAAAVDVVHGAVGDGPLRTLATALCSREARCHGGSEAVTDTCVDEVVASRKASARLLSAVRPARIAAMSACVDKRPCDDDDPVAHCP